jgi:hypothetical protein
VPDIGPPRPLHGGGSTGPTFTPPPDPSPLHGGGPTGTTYATWMSTSPPPAVLSDPKTVPPGGCLGTIFPDYHLGPYVCGTQ